MAEQTAESKSTSEEDRVRLDGVRLAARTLDYHLTHDLSLTVGYAELIADDPELPQRLGELARQVLQNALAAVETVRRLRRIDSLQLAHQGTFDGPLLNLDRAPKC